MSDANETIAAIVAEIRAYADRLDDAHGMPSPTDLRKLADRIERADQRKECDFGMALSIEEGLRKRDRERAGSAAAMREALADVDKYLGYIIPTRRENELRKACRAALAAPARNVDRPECRTADEAVKVYRAETEPDRQNPECYWPCIFSWLFDTVEKGGAK